MREYMDEPVPPQVAEAKLVCLNLRTKNAFGANVGYLPWQTGESGTGTYWCLKTMQTAGPDDGLVHPQECKVGRSCFKCQEE